MKVTDGVITNPDLVYCDDGATMLEHYGVRGMHWGVRNSETQARYSREGRKGKKKAYKQEAKAIRAKTKSAKVKRKDMRSLNNARVKSIKQERLEANRNRALLSDAELNQRIARLQKERQLNLLTQQELKPGRYAVKNALTNVGTETIKSESKSGIKTVKKKIAGK